MPLDELPEFVRLPKKKKPKSKLVMHGEMLGQTKEEIERRDRRMARFQDGNGGEGVRTTPPRVDTPDYARDAQIAASIVTPPPPAPQPTTQKERYRQPRIFFRSEGEF